MTRNNWLVVGFVLGGCSDATAGTRLSDQAVTSHLAPHRVVQDMADPGVMARMEEERAYKARCATGLVLLKRTVNNDGGPQAHQRLAGARAWLSLSRKSVAAHDWAGARECAQNGLRELGKLTGLAARLRVRVFDDSVLALGAAEDLSKKGRVRDAAVMMLEILEERTRLYVLYYADEIAE